MAFSYKLRKGNELHSPQHLHISSIPQIEIHASQDFYLIYSKYPAKKQACNPNRITLVYRTLMSLEPHIRMKQGKTVRQNSLGVLKTHESVLGLMSLHLGCSRRVTGLLPGAEEGSK